MILSFLCHAQTTNIARLIDHEKRKYWISLSLSLSLSISLKWNEERKWLENFLHMAFLTWSLKIASYPQSYDESFGSIHRKLLYNNFRDNLWIMNLYLQMLMNRAITHDHSVRDSHLKKNAIQHQQQRIILCS